MAEKIQPQVQEQVQAQAQAAIVPQVSKLKDTLLNFIVPITALALTGLLFFIVIYPSLKTLPILKADLEAKSVLENQLNTKLATLNKLLDFETVVKENAGIVARVLVSEATVPELLTQIDIIAKNSGLAVNKLSYSFGETNEDDSLLSYKVVNVSLGAVGNYNQISIFMKNLENSARFVDVETYRFASENVGDTVGLFNVTFILKSPYLLIESSAVTDEPVDVDVADPEFITLLEKIKGFRFYDISVDTRFEELEESTVEEIEESVGEDTVEESSVSEEELNEIIEEQEAI